MQRQQGICRAFRPFLHVADPLSGAFIKLPALRVVHGLNAILVRPKNLNILYPPHFVLITFTYR